MMGKARSPKDNPPTDNTTSHAVMVVPMFAPNSTPTDSRTVIMPAFTKLTSVTVTAELDCKTTVTNVPVIAPRPVLRVSLPSSVRMEAPLPLRMPSLMVRMPKRNNPRPPRMVKMKWSALMQRSKIGRQK